MRDAVGLIGKIVQIKGINYVIKDFYFVPDNPHSLYVGLQMSNYVTVNYRFKDLLPYLIEQIKL
jgi:hypothetical protein